MPDFAGMTNPKQDLIQLTLAYHLCRKTITGGPRATKRAIDLSPYFENIRATDILPILKPMRENFPCSNLYRAFRQFAVVFVSTRTEWGAIPEASKRASLKNVVNGAPSGSMASTFGVYGSVMKILFTFDIHYCMRRHQIEREYEDMKNLYYEFKKDQIVIPPFPENNLASLLDLDHGSSTGEQCAEFFNRMFTILANKGIFSPRLLTFLEIPFEQIQTEEEGRIVQLLGTTAHT